MIGFFIFIAALGLIYWLFKNYESPAETSFNKTSEIPHNKEIENEFYRVEQKIKNYSFCNVFEPAEYNLDWLTRKLPSNTVSVEQVQALLSTKSLAGPYGRNLLSSIAIESLPVLSPKLLNLDSDHYVNRIKKFQKKINEIHSASIMDIDRSNKLKEAYDLNQKSAIEDIVRLTLIR
jgi:hypothetical protein